MGNAGLLNKYRSSFGSNKNSSSSSSSQSTSQANNSFGAGSSSRDGGGRDHGNSGLVNSSGGNYNGNSTATSGAGGGGSASTSPRSTKIIISYDRWIKHECKKWGHFKYFDFNTLEYLSDQIALQAHQNNHHQHQLSYNGSFSFSISPPNNYNANSSTPKNANATDTQPSSFSPAMPHTNTLGYSNRAYSYSYSANLNQPISSPSTSSSAAGGGGATSSTTPAAAHVPEPVNSFPPLVNQYHSFSSNINNLNNDSIISNTKNGNGRLGLGQIHYVNGHFFKPIERLGDSQFIISQLSYNEIVVTVPCNIERYRPNDRTSREIAARLNRVIGVCEQFLVFQIWKGNNEVEIFIYDNKNESANATDASATNPNSKTNNIPIIQASSNRIVKKFNRRFNSRTYTCLISADRNTLLITPDYESNHSYWHHSHAHSESTLIINLNTFQLLRVIPARCDQRFAFDPRYGSPNYAAPRFAEFDTVRGQIVDLSTDKVVVCSNHTLKTKVFRVEYTRDGYLIIVICTLPIFQRRVRRNYFIYILNSSTLLHMRSIIDYRGPLLSTYMFSTDFNLLFNIYPSISNCSSSIAVLKNIEPTASARVIELYSLPSVSSMSLKEICRRVILRHVDDKNLNKLPLPPKLIAYLSYNNINFGSSSSSNLSANKVARGTGGGAKKSQIALIKKKKYKNEFSI